MRERTVLAMALAAALLASGCGGGNDSSADNESERVDTGATSISKAAFIEQVDSICSQTGKRTEKEFVDYAKEQSIGEKEGLSPSQGAEVVETILVPALIQQADEIRAVGAPAGDEDEVDAILREIDKAITTAEREPKNVESPQALLADADKLIKQYGFKVCGQR